LPLWTVNDAQRREGEGGGDIMILGDLKNLAPPGAGPHLAADTNSSSPYARVSSSKCGLLHDAYSARLNSPRSSGTDLARVSLPTKPTSQFPQEAPYLAKLPARRAAELLTLACPKAMLEIAVASTRRSARAFRTTMHPTAGPPPDGRLSAGPACPGPGAAAGRHGHIGEPALDVGLTHGVVCQFLPATSRSSAALTMPTIPLAPECIWTCRTSTVCL
jgi:hypothetical protein